MAYPFRAILRADEQPLYALDFMGKAFVAPSSNGIILDHLAQELRAYLDSDREALEPMCVPLAYLVAELLDNAWAANIDDILINYEFPVVHKPNGVQFHGATCTFGGEMEPLFAELELTPDGRAVARYDIRIGDASAGFQRIPMGKRIRNGAPEKWIFKWKRDFEHHPPA